MKFCGEMAQLENHKDSSSIPILLVGSQAQWCMLIIPALWEQRWEDLWGLLASLFGLSSELLT